MCLFLRKFHRVSHPCESMAPSTWNLHHKFAFTAEPNHKHFQPLKTCTKQNPRIVKPRGSYVTAGEMYLGRQRRLVASVPEERGLECPVSWPPDEWHSEAAAPSTLQLGGCQGSPPAWSSAGFLVRGCNNHYKWVLSSSLYLLYCQHY